MPRKRSGAGDWVLKGRLEPPRNPSEIGRVIGPSRGDACDASNSLRKKLKEKADQAHRFEGRPCLVAVNACHSDFFWDTDDTMDIRKALFAKRGDEGQTGEFCPDLHRISGVMVFYHAVLGNELGAKVRLFRNGDKKIPECLVFLANEQRLGKLLGLEP